jgi:outer membrane receptor protein involved in Fe transport
VAGGLTLNAAAAYNDAKTKGNICNAPIPVDPSPDCTGLDNDGDPDEIAAPSGRRLPVTPKLKMTGTARYSWDMGIGKAHVQGSVVHQGSAPSFLKSGDAVLGKLPASTLVDLFAGYDWKNMSFEAFATNVFDAHNQLSRFTICGSICGTPDFLHIVPGRPRTIGIRAGVKF